MCAVSAKPVAHVRLPGGADFGQLRAGLQIRYLSPSGFKGEEAVNRRLVTVASADAMEDRLDFIKAVNPYWHYA
jgi:hypothetical protein